MKPTTKQIRKEAELTYLESWQPELQMAAYEEGAKWALSQDSTIEKVKELTNQLEQLIKDCQSQADSFFEKGMTISEATSLAMKVAYQNTIDLIKLNAIIEAK